MRRLVLGAAVIATCAPLGATGPKWVPLNSVRAGSVDETNQGKPQPAPAPVAAKTPEPAPAPQPESVAAVAAQPVQAVAPVTRASSGVQQPLQITCFGGGTAKKATAATGLSSGSVFGMAGTTSVSGITSGTTTVFGTRQQGFGDQVDIRLFSGDDRIRMPRTMLPPLHGGDHGWFKLKDVVADARSIRASAAVNFLNNPKVYIDRVTGTISISGRAGDYAGTCQATEPDATTKF